MSEVKHTPGPWVLIDGDRFEKEKVITTQSRIDNSMGCICDMDVDFYGYMGVEQEANARLIATAPELPDALKAAIECGMVPTSSAREGGACKHSIQCQVADQIRDAIAKAEGRA